MRQDELFAAHEGHIGLQFSGGRDSLAVLLLLRFYWSKLTVYFLDGGDEYPETLELVARVAMLVPNFVRIPGRVEQTRKDLGWPSDVNPPGAGWPLPGMHEPGHLQLSDRYTCCYYGVAVPMHQWMTKDGVTLIIRGQKDADLQKAPLKSLDKTENGTQVYFPIQDWSVAQVNRFIEDQGWDLPPYYAEGASAAPECMHCTAWLEHGALPYLRKHHPEQAKEVNRRLNAIAIAVEPYYEGLLGALHG